MKVEIWAPKPHSKKQRVIMNAFNWQGVSEIWVANGTKYGKTLAAATALCTSAPLKSQSLWRWIAPIYTQSNIGYKYCRRMLPGAPIIKKNDNALTLEIPTNDTMIQFFHGRHPETLEGEATSGNILDEAAKMKHEVYIAVKTTTTVTRGPILLISTPFGKNWFYKGCMSAKEEMLRARHENRIPTKIFITAASTDNPKVSAEVIEEARRSLPDRLFRQYYLAEFVDDGTVFSGFRDCVYTDPIDMYGEYHKWFADGASEATVVIGADWAKIVDWTVFTAIDIKTRKVIGFERFHRKPYTEAIRNLVRFSSKFAECQVVFHDKTGVGEAIDDQLAYTGLTYKGIIFTNASKSEMVNRLITAFEQKLIFIPKWNILESELDSYEVKTNAIGSMSFGASSGDHDDAVCSLLLANAALLQYGEYDTEVRFLEDLPNDKSIITADSLEKFYRDITEDDED